MKTKTIIKLTFLILLFGCEPIIHKGVIIRKRYEPSRVYMYSTPMIIGKTVIPQIHTGYDDEDWVITVQSINGSTKDFYIDESNWKSLKIGDTFNDSIPCKT